jgi:hypothetical protein
MKIAIVGTRNGAPASLFSEILSKYPDITEIVSGGAKGVDSQAAEFAKANNFKLTVFPAEWGKYGKAAGIIRNQQIIDYADKVIAFPSRGSKGTLDSINRAKKQKKLLYIKYVD